jgi:hypothetical protein
LFDEQLRAVDHYQFDVFDGIDPQNTVAMDRDAIACAILGAVYPHTATCKDKKGVALAARSYSLLISNDETRGHAIACS